MAGLSAPHGAFNASDAVGSFQAPTLVHSGLAAYDPYPPRWGDYSGIALDPFDADASIWVAGEYVPTNGANWGTWIAKVSAGSACALPSTPTGLVAAPGDTQVALNWSASPGATAYTVKRATTSGGPYTTIASGLAATIYTDAGLTNGTTYYYVVSATKACGESANSAQATATPIAVQPATVAPTRVNAVGAKGKVKLSWTQSTSQGVTQNKIYPIDHRRRTVRGDRVDRREHIVHRHSGDWRHHVLLRRHRRERQWRKCPVESEFGEAEIAEQGSSRLLRGWRTPRVPEHRRVPPRQ